MMLILVRHGNSHASMGTQNLLKDKNLGPFFGICPSVVLFLGSVSEIERIDGRTGFVNIPKPV
jgi:hypothetical protein